MNRYTIAPDFVEMAAKNSYYLLNVLIVFAQDNRFKLCMDDKEMAYKCYESIIKRHESIRFWMSLLNNSSRNIEKIKLKSGKYSDSQDLFLAIADVVFPNKRLITGDKSLFNDKQNFINNHGVNIIDGDEAKDYLQRAYVNITLGDNSPIVNGNNNKIE